MRINVRTHALFIAATAIFTGCTLSFTPQPVDAPPMAVEAQPQVEIVAETDVPVVAVDEYYFVGGRYYYWHPGVDRYVVLRGLPPHGHRILHMDHLAPRRDVHGYERRTDARPASPSHPPKQPASQPNQQQQKKKQNNP